MSNNTESNSAKSKDKDTTTDNNQSKKSEDKPAKSIIEALEEDDEFEEFDSAAAWDDVKNTGMNDDEAVQWQDNWDDDDIDEDFTRALRAELTSNLS